MTYTPTEYVLIQDAFVVSERAKHVKNVIDKHSKVKNIVEKEYKPKKATKKEMKEMRSWGVRYKV